jgi:hypothetical protein
LLAVIDAAVFTAPVALVTALIAAGTLIAQLSLWRVMRRLNAEQSPRHRRPGGKLQAPERLHCFRGAPMRDPRGQNSHPGLQVLPGGMCVWSLRQTWPAPCECRSGRERTCVLPPYVNVEEIAVFNGFCDDLAGLSAIDLRLPGSARIAGDGALFAVRACLP